MSNPLDELASEYVLGTLPGEQRAEVEQRLQHDPELRAAVDAWEQRLLPLTALAAPVTPSPQVVALPQQVVAPPQQVVVPTAAPSQGLHSGARAPSVQHNIAHYDMKMLDDGVRDHDD